uniref:Uncharacterized protein n=1 Tax=Tanacetum cinerariifolium TaxID=118510 RepID=A0A699I7R5_TANCI|nr:hypothetical protein [Tanacetum cinerariifolium]
MIWVSLEHRFRDDVSRTGVDESLIELCCKCFIRFLQGRKEMYNKEKENQGVEGRWDPQNTDVVRIIGAGSGSYRAMNGVMVPALPSHTFYLITLRKYITLPKMSNKVAVRKSKTQATDITKSSQPSSLLFLYQLDVDVSGTIVVMISRMWDVNAITWCYLSTDFVFSDSKGNMIHCTASGNIAHNFPRLKEGGIYSIKNYVVHPNKDDFRIVKHATFMLEFDGATTIRKASVSDVDVTGYVTNVGRKTYKKSGSRTLDFYLANQRFVLSSAMIGFILISTFAINFHYMKHGPGTKGDTIGRTRRCFDSKEDKTCWHVCHCFDFNVYKALQHSSTMIYDDENILTLQELKTEGSVVESSKEVVSGDCSQPKEGTLENVLIWARNRKNDVWLMSRPGNDGTTHPVVVVIAKKELPVNLESGSAKHATRRLSTGLK